MKKSALVIFLFICLLCGAQTGFDKAYIVTEKGDTVKGEAKLNPKKEHEVYDRIYFKDPSGVAKNYKASKITGYGVNNDHYISLENDGEPKFYRILVRGPINLYMIVFESMQMNEVSFEPEYYLAQPGNKKLVVVKKNKFKKQITDWMKDNPEFANAYVDEKKFDQEKAVALITQYNTWKAGQP